MKTIITLPKTLPRFAVVHKASGAGYHKDKRTNRDRSRGDQRRNALKGEQ